MTILPPLLALALAVFGLTLGRVDQERRAVPILRAVASLLALAVGAYLASRFAPGGERNIIVVGLASGVATVMVAAWVPKRQGSAPGLLALGTIGPAAFLAMPDAGLKNCCLAFTIGLGFAALTIGDDVASTTAIGGAMVALATLMGRYSSSAPYYTHAGVALALGVSLLGVIGNVVKKSWPKADRALPIALRVIALGFAYSLGTQYLHLNAAWVCMALALAAGFAVVAILPRNELSNETNEQASDPGRSVLAAVIWVALGTLAFGLARGYGMALALLLAGGLHLVLGEKRALTSTGPLLGLVMYRVFREAHVEASRALDIGQHYALIGLLLGTLLPILPERWWALKPSRPEAQAFGGFLWTLVWIAFPSLVAILLGAKGVVGFVAGAGMSSVFALLLPETSQLPLAVAASAGGLAILTYDWLDTLIGMSRDDKVQWVLKGGIPVAIAVAVIASLNDRKPAASQVSGDVR